MSPLELEAAIGERIGKWQVSAVGLIGGERCYWLLDKHGTVALYPAHTVAEMKRR